MNDDFMKEYIIPFIKNDLVPFAITILIALLVLWIGHKIIKKLVKFVGKRLEKSNTDATLQPFFLSMINIGMKILLYISVIGIVGIPTTSFAAILAAAGLAVGMALSGTLQNFAGGVMLLLFKPFKVDDLIEAQGHLGIVKEITLFVTILTTLDNKTIIIPNGPLSNGSMVNFSTENLRRVDWTFGVAYGDSVDRARKVLLELIAQDARILSEPEEPFIAVSELNSSSVDFTVRAWGKQEDYWDIYFELNEKVYNTFAKEGLSIPFPQMDVHVHNT